MPPGGAASGPARGPGGRRSPSLRRRLALAAVACLLALLLCEGALQVALPPQSRYLGQQVAETGILRPDPVCGWRMLPDRTVTMRLATGREVVVRTNSAGFRDIEHPVESADGRPRVLVAGDSFVFGFGVGDDELMTEYLRQRLPEAEVLNFGVTGFNLVQTRRLLEAEGFRYRPRIVCLALCQNDITRQVVPVRIKERTDAVRDGTKQWLYDHVRLYMLLRNAIGRSRRLTDALVDLGLLSPPAGYADLDPNLRPFLVRWPEELERDWQDTTGELLAIRDACGAHGASLVVALIPALQSVDPGALDASLRYMGYYREDFDLDKSYRLLHRFCEEHGIPCVGDPGPFREGGAAFYLPGDMHLDAAGHALFASQIGREVRAQLAGGPPVSAATGR